jgi:hypothetical protein
MEDPSVVVNGFAEGAAGEMVEWEEANREMDMASLYIGQTR